MVITINLKRYPTFIITVFNGKCNFFDSLVSIITTLKRKNKKLLISLINNIFLEEYKDIFFHRGKSGPEEEVLENLFIEKNTEFSSLYSDLILTFYEKETYTKMFEVLLKFDLSYKNFFEYHQEKIDNEEKPAYKLCISQSLIHVAFTKEKAKYLTFKDEKEKYYEYNLIKRIIDKDMEETVAKYGDEYKTLFRKEDLCDDVLKYIFFIF